MSQSTTDPFHLFLFVQEDSYLIRVLQYSVQGFLAAVSPRAGPALTLLPPGQLANPDTTTWAYQKGIHTLCTNNHLPVEAFKRGLTGTRRGSHVNTRPSPA